MKVLIDMNLSPAWVDFFERSGIQASHWSSVGARNAKDYEIVEYARKNSLVVLTYDLDFGAILALTNADGPSVIQVRSQNVAPGSLAPIVIGTVQRNQEYLLQGALIVIDESRERVRILPLRKE